MARQAAQPGPGVVALALGLVGACGGRALPRNAAGASDGGLFAGTGDAGDAAGGDGGTQRGRQLAVGDDFSCALRADRSIACWGLNRNGQATPPPGQFDAVSAGASFACAIRAGGTLAGGTLADGTIVCWGRNLVLGPLRVPTSVMNVGPCTRMNRK